MTESAAAVDFKESCEGKWLQQRQGKTLKTNRYLCLQVCQSKGLPTRDLYFATSRGSGDCIWKTTGEVISVQRKERKHNPWPSNDDWLRERFLEEKEPIDQKWINDRLFGDWSK